MNHVLQQLAGSYKAAGGGGGGGGGSLITGINAHDLMWVAPGAMQIGLYTALGVKIQRSDINVDGSSTGYIRGFGSATCASTVNTWATALKNAGIQPMIVFAFNGGMQTTSTMITGIQSIIASTKGLWFEWGNELDGWQGGSRPASPPTASAYNTQFASIVSAIHSADSTAKIGPAPVANVNPGGSGWNLMSSYLTGGLASVPYDFLPFHNYPFPTGDSPTTVWDGQVSAITAIPNWTAQAASCGNTKPNWMTECGWDTDDVTQAVQASYMSQFWQSAQVQALPVMIPYEMYDDGQNYGWMTSSDLTGGGTLTAKTVYNTMKALL